MNAKERTVVERWCEKAMQARLLERTDPLLANSYRNEANGVGCAMHVLEIAQPEIRYEAVMSLGQGRFVMVMLGRVKRKVVGGITWEDVGELSAYFKL